MANRFHVLKLYGRRVIAPVLHGERRERTRFSAHADRAHPQAHDPRGRRLLREDPRTRQWLETALERSPKVRTVYQFMQQLKSLSNQARAATRTASSACRLGAPKPRRAEFARSGDFARQLQAYTVQPPPPTPRIRERGRSRGRAHALARARHRSRSASRASNTGRAQV